ncbi:MAG: hypothetical protein E7401_03790 [Ruminococcaceae bacterium]|nr:hypothetical protein [Oscillospiraceae bacterium]
MIRNIDILLEIQDRIHKFRILDDVIAVHLEDKDTEFSDLIENPYQEMCDFLNAINDIDKLLDSLTEDLRGSMVNDGFDLDDYKFWNACVIHSPYNLEGLLETFEGAIETLELYILETVRGYKILTQLAYDKNPRLPGLNKQEDNG